MKTIGLLGGIASGKSVVARRLAELGATVVDADRAAHEVLRMDDVRRAARARWGEAIFGPDGHVDRQALGRIVFARTPEAHAERVYLESLTHPLVGMVILQQMAAARGSGAPAVVLDVPLLLESGMAGGCDTVWYVDAPREQRLARALGRGWTEAEFASREAAQPDLAEKQARSDVRIDNSGNLESTYQQVDQFWRRLLG